MSRHIVIEGNLATDPQGGHGNDTGTPYIRLHVAVHDRTRARDGSYTSRPTVYYRVTAFGSRAEHALASLHRGDTVIAAGICTVQSFQRSNGTTGHTRELTAQHLGVSLAYRDVTTAPRSSAAIQL